MGEVLPNAIPLMAKAAQKAGLSISGTVKEMMELQTRGELISSKVLPHFAELMSEAAQANGGLEKALQSNRVAMNRFTFSLQESADQFFKSGFAEGLTEFFNTTAKFITNNSDLWEALGKIVGSALKGISLVIKAITPVFKTFGAILKGLTDMFGDFSGALAIAFSPLALITLGKFAASFGTINKAVLALTASVRGLVLPLMLAFGFLEELVNYYTNGDLDTFIGTRNQDKMELEELKKKDFQELGHFERYRVLQDGPSIGDAMSSLFSNLAFAPSKPPQIAVNVQANVPMEVLGAEITNTNSYQNATEAAIRDRVE